MAKYSNKTQPTGAVYSSQDIASTIEQLHNVYLVFRDIQYLTKKTPAHLTNFII